MYGNLIPVASTERSRTSKNSSLIYLMKPPSLQLEIARGSPHLWLALALKKNKIILKKILFSIKTQKVLKYACSINIVDL